jgi:hypothetical protein
VALPLQRWIVCWNQKETHRNDGFLFDSLSLQVAVAARVEGIAQAVTDQIDTQDRQNDKEAWKNPHPP